MEIESLAGRRASVIGAARSGVAAVRALRELGAIVTLSDSKAASELGESADEARASGATCVFGANIEQALPEETALVVTSPGVPVTAGVLRAAVARGIPVWSEIE